MESEARDTTEVLCFPYFCEQEGEAYLDVYFTDALLPEGYARFVLKAGYMMAAEEELRFC